MSKILKLCLATIMDAHLVTSDNQFGFKQKHSTDLCIYTVKSIIQYYNYYNSPVYTHFLGASKIFDRVNHWTVFKKTYIKGCANYCCASIMFFLSFSATLYTMGQNEIIFFTLILTVLDKAENFPQNCFLFRLTICLNCGSALVSAVFLDNVCFNRVFYADDLLMAPCANAIQQLLNICHNYSITVDENFNALE